MLAFAAAITIFYVFARYRYPLVPVVVLFAAVGATGLWGRCRQSQSTDHGRGQSEWRELGIGLALGLVAAVSCNWPLPAWYRDDEITYFNVGTCLMDENRYADAVDPFRQAIRIKPDFAAAYNNLGRALLELKQLPAAGDSFRHATKFDPQQAAAWFGLGEVKQQQGDLEGALAALKQAIAVDPKFSGALRGGTPGAAQRKCWRGGRLSASRGRAEPQSA